MKLAVFGTFDIGNYGDLLFPYVIEHQVRARVPDVEIQLYSYRRKTRGDWLYDVKPVEDFPADAGDTNLVVVGGGHLVHFVKRMADGYRPTRSGTPHPLGFWWLPAVYARAVGLPVFAHGISVGPHIPAFAAPLMRSFVESLTGGGVRDEESLRRLARHGSTERLGLVPDSIFDIADLVPGDARSPEHSAWCVRHGIGERYLILQPSRGLRRYVDVIRPLVRQAAERGWSVIELPIGRELHNEPNFYQLPGVDIVRVADWPSPLLLTEIIAHAQAAIGISLHLSIVSSVYSVPVFRPPYDRDSKFIALDGIPSIATFGEPRAAELVGKDDRVHDNAAVLAPLRGTLDAHWSAMVDAASAPAPGSADPGLWRVLADGALHAHARRGLQDRIADAREVWADTRKRAGRSLIPRVS